MTGSIIKTLWHAWGSHRGRRARPIALSLLATTLIGAGPVEEPATIAEDFTVAVAGDVIYLRPMLATLEARAPDLLALLRDAGATFGNFETNVLDLTDFRGSPQAESGGTWMFAAPGIVADIKAMGFDLVGMANNHATDWGVEGMNETNRRLDDAGIVHAGTGQTLAAARAPRYLDTGGGRIGMVSATSSFTPMSRAADPIGRVPGRGGVNAVRTTRTVLVPPATLTHLENVARLAGGRNGRNGDHVELMGTRYAAGEDGAVTYSYAPNPADITGNLRSVRQAHQNANLTLFSIHNHEPGNDSVRPANFAQPLARAVIDSGADMYLGHGPHQLRGIEIYKCRPIFYSLGNFAMMNNSLDDVPRDMYEQLAATEGTTVPELLAGRNQRDFSNSAFFESVIAKVRFRGNRAVEITLHPIDLGLTAKGADKGVPKMADAATGRRILARLQHLSAPYGTRITIENGVGMIRPCT